MAKQYRVSNMDDGLRQILMDRLKNMYYESAGINSVSANSDTMDAPKVRGMTKDRHVKRYKAAYEALQSKEDFITLSQYQSIILALGGTNSYLGQKLEELVKRNEKLEVLNELGN